VSIDRELYDKLQNIRHNKGMNLEKILSFLVEKELVPGKVPSSTRKGKAVGSGRYIPRSVKANVVKRDSSQCQNCGSTHKVQIDHIIPIGRGGKSETNNLRLLCRNCNLRAGIQDFGLKRMKRA